MTASEEEEEISVVVREGGGGGERASEEGGWPWQDQHQSEDWAAGTGGRMVRGF